MVIFKGVVCGLGQSLLGTVSSIVWLWWSSYRRARLLYPTGGIGFDVSSLGHNSYLALAYCCFVLGLILVGIPRAASRRIVELPMNF